ncbi:MAG: DUF6371 domain-containing protein [Paludibacter sp.]|nr:DUF6371 domain-containing protein [Paludibacter sp.]
MNYPQPYLQKYKGKATRHTCPSCETKQSFTLYLDGNTHEPIHHTVGKCNRESKCGYHYTPKQYYIDNPSIGVETRHASSNISNQIIKKVNPPQPPGSISFRFVENSVSYKSNFVRFLFDHFSDEQIRSVAENYALGATKNKEVIFWQIDITGKVRTGKIMQYNPASGKRIKHESGAIDWVHNKLKQKKQLLEDFNLQQCFFGEHLLKIYPDKQVAIVESEKSAIIARCIVPDMIWLAAGTLNGLSIEKCQVFKGRDVMLYPDLGAFEKWSFKSAEIHEKCNCKVTVSTLLEDEATDTDRANGLDIADFIITELKLKKTSLEIQSYFSPSLQSMIDKNKALLILINGLQLEEI